MLTMNGARSDHHTAGKATRGREFVRRRPNLFANVRGQPASRLFDYSRWFVDDWNPYGEGVCAHRRSNAYELDRSKLATEMATG
jgi:hypothetical protein